MARTISKRKNGNGVLSAKSQFIDNFKDVVGDILADLSAMNIFSLTDFNGMNHAIMEYQMYRNPAEKDRILQLSGSSAYYNGNSENHSEIPNMPSYTALHNYLYFSDTAAPNENGGVLTTYTNNTASGSNVFNRMKYFWDLPNSQSANEDNQSEPSVGVAELGDLIERNSILHKTRRLMEQGKIKTIVSQFHTDRTIQYNGQVATENFGESHGRNLLTKQAETSGQAYKVNGFDNPYCRVWTHHYQYDRLSRTMRAGKTGINYWGGDFEWTDDEKKFFFPQYNVKQDDMRSEKYAYAWRGDHNQSRRERYSVLDSETGLLKIAPKYINGEASNIHSKDCMFSIENLAWKDYDPYSFTQALSWEQRGPLGGRIMWFPPYGITFNETATANWNSSDFIGRGEKVYTYVNSERRGNLSFLMVTDHPSSIDYSSWWDNDIDKENDYHRYFAGCMEDINGQGTAALDKDGKPFKDGRAWIEDNIIEAPTFLTDEYTDLSVNDITAKGEHNPPKPSPIETKDVDENSPSENIVEFYVFFPNNYSGINDAPFTPSSQVNAIGYILNGRNAQKKTNGNNHWDMPIDGDMVGSDGGFFQGVGYEMNSGSGITSPSQSNSEYILGGVYGLENYVADNDKKWYYRIDHVVSTSNGEEEYKGGEQGYKNTITQKLTNPEQNYKDNTSFSLNKDSSSIPSDFKRDENTTLYSFAEVACALYKIKGSDNAYHKLYNSFSNTSKQHVDELEKTFEDCELKTVECSGMSTSHGDSSSQGHERNNALASNRARTIMSWIRSYSKWSGIENSSDGIESASTALPNNTDNVNDKQAKLYRCAHCVMTFSDTKDTTKNESDPIAEHVKDNEYFEHVDFWECGTRYTSGDMVQFNEKLYVCISDNSDEETLSSEHWDDISDLYGDWDEYASYNVGDIVLNQGVYYKVIQSVTAKSPSGASEYMEYPNFIELTDEEVTKYVGSGLIKDTVNYTYYKRKPNAPAYNQVAGSESDLTMDEIKTKIESCGDIWFRANDSDDLKLLCEFQDSIGENPIIQDGFYGGLDNIPNKLRYDQEYHFYKQYFSDRPMVFKTLQEKIKYFNPVFHSMTPEGFNARLTFLHQCTRQGMTKTMGDRGGKTANNLAFGRPPYCVLRLGDFYNQLIVINSISFDYSVSDGITWDLNTEGNGVQPMLCKVNIDFNFIGGGDITGPVRRLQNAMSFNYYANTSFYDNRADRVVYEGDNYKTMGGAGNNRVAEDKSYAYTPKMYDDRKYKTVLN